MCVSWAGTVCARQSAGEVRALPSISICFSIIAFLAGSAMAASYSACVEHAEPSHGSQWPKRAWSLEVHVRGNYLSLLDYTTGELAFRDAMRWSCSGVERTTRRSERFATCLHPVDVLLLLAGLLLCDLRCTAAQGSLNAADVVKAMSGVNGARADEISLTLTGAADLISAALLFALPLGDSRRQAPERGGGAHSGWRSRVRSLKQALERTRCNDRAQRSV